MSKKLSFDVAKHKCQRAVYLRAKNNWHSWAKPAELLGISEPHLKSCLLRVHPGQDYCFVEKKLCHCVVRISKFTPACAFDFIVNLKDLEKCPK